MMRSTFLFLLTLILSATQTHARQSLDRDWDYEKYPGVPYILNNTELNIELSPDVPELQGEVLYLLESRIPDLHSVTFHAGRISVSQITSEGSDLDFSVSGDSLFIQFRDTLDVGDKTEFRISWSAASVYGFNRDYMGNTWSSLNPKAVRHWIPLPDHPVIESTVDASFTIPAGKEVVFNGQRVSDEVQSADTKTIRWTSGNPVPFTGLSFATGSFVIEEALSGITKVSLFTPEGMLMEEVREGLLRNAVNELKNAESALSFEYPYESLNIVILPEHTWEEVHAGSGIVYLYQDLGSLALQLKRGIASQWIGNYLRFRTAEDALVKSEFLKTRLLMNDKKLLLQNPGLLKSIAGWNAAVTYADSAAENFYLNTIDRNLANTVRSEKGMLNWEDFASGWYNQTGVYWENLPFETVQQPEEPNRTVTDTITVHTGFDEMSSVLTVYFESGTSTVDSLINIDARVYAFDDTTSSGFTFTGARDTSRTELPQTTEYIVFDQPQDEGIYLKVGKLPLSFLLNMLRSESAEHRILGSRGLQYHSENPDLQLALRDILSSENDPDVKAEIYRTLAVITNGATGTEQTFIQLVNSSETPVRLAALEALRNYTNNEEVSYALETAVMNADNDEVFAEALETYSRVSSDSLMVALSEKLSRREADASRQISVLEKSLVSDNSGATMQIADALTASEYPYQIRRKALQLLIRHDSSEAYWSAKISQLSNDTDPRIRRDVLGGLVHLTAAEKNTVISTVLSEEDDPRVRTFAEIMRDNPGTETPGVVN